MYIGSCKAFFFFNKTPNENFEYDCPYSNILLTYKYIEKMVFCTKHSFIGEIRSQEL